MIKHVWNVLLKLRCGVSVVDLVLSTARNAGFIKKYFSYSSVEAVI